MSTVRPAAQPDTPQHDFAGQCGRSSDAAWFFSKSTFVLPAKWPVKRGIAVALDGEYGPHGQLWTASACSFKPSAATTFKMVSKLGALSPESAL